MVSTPPGARPEGGSQMLALLAARALGRDCADLFEWQYWCEAGQPSDAAWCRARCLASNSWEQECEVYEAVGCAGNRTFTRVQWCPNANGAHYGTAVFLSCVFGVLGADRLYLGYYQLALVKLFTGGFFLVGYVVDCVLVTLQIVGPADGRGYAAGAPFPFLTQHPHRDVM